MSDFLLAVIKTENRKVVEWLIRGNFICLCLERIGPNYPPAVQETAVSLLVTLINVSSGLENTFDGESFVRHLFSIPFLPATDTFMHSITLLKAYVNSHGKGTPKVGSDTGAGDGNLNHGDGAGDDGGDSNGGGDGHGNSSGDGRVNSSGGVNGTGGSGGDISGGGGVDSSDGGGDGNGIRNSEAGANDRNGSDNSLDVDRDIPVTLYRAFDLIIARLPEFKQLLIGEDRTRLGPYGLIHICGRESIAVVEFIDSLIRTSHRHVNSAIADQDLISACFSVFFRCPLNNFYHSAVLQLVEGIFVVGNDDDFKISVVKQTNLLNLILEGFQNCNQKDDRGYCHGLYGYGGHLYQIATIVSKQKSNEKLAPLLEQNTKWTEFEAGDLIQMMLLYLPTEVWNKR